MNEGLAIPRRMLSAFALALVVAAPARAQQAQLKPPADKPARPATAQPAQPATAQPAAAADKVLVTVNGVPIKQSDFEQALRQVLSQGTQDSPQVRDALSKELIARELFLQEAKKQQLDKDAEILAATEEFKRQQMVQKYLRSQIKLAPVTDEQVKAAYDQEKADAAPKEYKLRAIMVPTDQRAKEVREQLAKGKDFAELARAWSLAPSAANGGDLGWVPLKTEGKGAENQGVPMPIIQAIVKLQKGKYTEPIDVQGRWWIVKLDDVRDTKIASFDQAKPNLQRALQTRELQRAVGELAAKLSKTATINPQQQ